MPIRMQSLKAFPYAGRRLKVGEHFNARGEGERRLLTAIKVAEVAPPPVPAARAAAPVVVDAPRARLTTRAIEAVSEPVESAPEPVVAHPATDAVGPVAEPSALEVAPGAPAAPAAKTPRSSYRRRDLVADKE